MSIRASYPLIHLAPPRVYIPTGERWFDVDSNDVDNHNPRRAVDFWLLGN